MEIKRLALVGNPNTGKSSLFNHLTGLNQQIGNFPGVTVDKKTGTYKTDSGQSIEIIDLPGTYSLFPRSNDERVVYQTLSDQKNELNPDAVIAIVDASNVKRNLLLFSQVYDLGLPMIMVLTMNDVADRRNLIVEAEELRRVFPDIDIIKINARTGDGIEDLKRRIKFLQPTKARMLFGSCPPSELIHDEGRQLEDAMSRFERIRSITSKVVLKRVGDVKSITAKLDRYIVHPVWGYVIFLSLLLLIFQVIYNIASYPMDWIDGAFLQFSDWAKSNMAEGVFTNLLAEGIIPGIGGVVVFVPQIALLFLFLAILEETGYMARVVFIMDRLVRPFGLNGKSVVPLMSSVACAIPGVMSTRTISSWKDRLITILVAPLMSCSARIPVYTLLIALVIPEQSVFGFFNLRGLVLFALYALGLVSALLVAMILKWIIQSKDHSFLLLEMPSYKAPRWGHVLITLWEKVRVFIFDAGKVILAISILLWALASYGPSERIQKAEENLKSESVFQSLDAQSQEDQLSAVKLENSYIGIMGHAIEPAIAPLGFDWKIGISLITSFAAREVFVGSMATIYSVGEDFEESDTLLNRLREERDPKTGQLIYSLATGASLMVFYVYAMQCMATLAIVKRETKSWKWPLIQLGYMGALAYIASFITYHLLV